MKRESVLHTFPQNRSPLVLNLGKYLLVQEKTSWLVRPSLVKGKICFLLEISRVEHETCNTILYSQNIVIYSNDPELFCTYVRICV